MHFVYSGNFIGQAERTQFDFVRMIMGIHTEEFTWNLKPGVSFQAPEVVMIYSGEGDYQSRLYHFIRLDESNKTLYKKYNNDSLIG